MRLRIGYELDYDFPQPTPVLSVLNVHFSRASDLEAPDIIRLDPPVPLAGYRDGFGNWCGRFTAPAGRIRISTDTVIRDSGLPDPVIPDARQHPIEELPDEALVFLLASRFCESDRMLDLAWQLFGATEPGWPRVQAICDFAHDHIRFDYAQARPTRSAFEAYARRRRRLPRLRAPRRRLLPRPQHPGALLHRLPRRRRHPEPWPPGDFAAWFEAYLGGRWHLFDPRNNIPRQAACSWPTAATPPTSRSPPPSAPASCRASASGPTRLPADA